MGNIVLRILLGLVGLYLLSRGYLTIVTYIGTKHTIIYRVHSLHIQGRAGHMGNRALPGGPPLQGAHPLPKTL